MKKLLLLVLLAGCAHAPSKSREQTFREYMDGWVGKNIREVVAKFGPPTSEWQDGVAAIYQWEVRGKTYLQAGYGSVSAETEACKTWLEVSPEGQVTHWHSHGNCAP